MKMWEKPVERSLEGVRKIEEIVTDQPTCGPRGTGGQGGAHGGA